MAHNFSLFVENLIRVARGVSKKNNRKRVEPKGMWHAMAMGDHIAKEWGQT